MATGSELPYPWKCDFCGTEAGVENGFCPKCGPSQTTPVSDDAKKEAGVYIPPVITHTPAQEEQMREVTAIERT